MNPEVKNPLPPQAPFQRAFVFTEGSTPLTPLPIPETSSTTPPWNEPAGRETMQVTPYELPMVPDGLKTSFLAQQLPEGKILSVRPENLHEARRLDRKNGWLPVVENGIEVHDDPYKRGGRKVAGVVIEVPKGIEKGQLPKELVARAGSWIRQSEDPKNPHLGGIFVVWPQGEYKPTKEELEKMFRDANLKADDSEEPIMYEAELDDGRKAWVAQARTYKKQTVPVWVKDGYRAGEKPPKLPEPKTARNHPELTCGDCGEHNAVGHVEIVERKSGKYLIERILCESGKHRNGNPEINNVLLKTIERYDTTPQR